MSVTPNLEVRAEGASASHPSQELVVALAASAQGDYGHGHGNTNSATTSMQGSNRSVNRVHLTEQNREVLVKLCVANRMDFSYKKGTKAPFWNRIRALLRMEIGKDLKNPDMTICQLANERRAIVGLQKTESGTVQKDTEMDQNLDIWIERENELQQEQENAKKPKEIVDKEAAQAAVHRDNLMVSHARKRYYSSGSSDRGSDDTEIPSVAGVEDHAPGRLTRSGTSYDNTNEFLDLTMETDEQQTAKAVQKVRHLRKKTRHQDQQKQDREVDSKIIDALTGMGKMVSDALIKMGSSESGEGTGGGGGQENLDAVQAMNNRIDGLEDTMRATNEKTQEMLHLILSRLGPSPSTS